MLIAKRIVDLQNVDLLGGVDLLRCCTAEPGATGIDWTVKKDITSESQFLMREIRETDIESKKFEIPRNAYRAVLEVYVSFHENDEFWEVLVTLDGIEVGAVWPCTVIYTGGVNPLLWRPITVIGSFDLPSYDIEVTPFLGTMLDEKTHEIAFRVTNALNVWLIDANLHVWRRV
ncbi:peptide-N4-(N-acetyl-beta-glucosaminyl) asparagine amidase A protein [Actinidia rufa]|uniref:Peptide-N4-(N-acetyl-beta-glucosaminyl) asparagine amidase A protein n=1 Tax=Actinidia rufa TaxID=165716 RepID=A0A7J0GNK9_9ERIC|nr:peptide-N4-(N-acetyl-beta-glucosaminyl) asparagine amidase A protein [Actinidia rufa]